MVLQAKLYLHILFYCTALHLNATLMFYTKQTGDLEKLASILSGVAVLCHQVTRQRQRQINCGKQNKCVNKMNQFSGAPELYFLLHYVSVPAQYLTAKF